MTSSPAPAAARFSVRGVQLSRAAIAALAAIMITFSPDHSASVGLAVFSGFAIATALVLLLAGWLTYPAGRRWAPFTMGVIAVILGMAAGIVVWRSTALFFTVVIVWALATGLVETIWGLRDRRVAAISRTDARDTLVTGVLTLVLGVALLLVPAQYALTYVIDGAPEAFTLTGIIIAVGILGGYAAIVAVYLGIAGFSPGRSEASVGDQASAAPEAEGTA